MLTSKQWFKLKQRLKQFEMVEQERSTQVALRDHTARSEDDCDGNEADADHVGLSPEQRASGVSRKASRSATPRAGVAGDEDDEDTAAKEAARTAKREAVRRATSSESHSMGLLIGGISVFLALGCTVMFTFGSACIVTGESQYCGVGGVGGGITMVALAALTFIGGGVRLLWYTISPRRSAKH